METKLTWAFESPKGNQEVFTKNKKKKTLFLGYC